MTTSSISSTGSISSAGIGSGLDVNGIISSLMAVESQPLTLLQNKASTINTEISAVGQIQSLASALGDKAQALSSPGLWSQTTSTSADPSVVTADTSSGKAVAGNYQVSVQQLAQGQTVSMASAVGSSSATLDTGSITIQLGTWTPGTGGASPTFQAATPAAVPITIGPGETSLSAIRDKINAANAGVNATIITDASGARLSLQSTATGLASGFQITTTEDGAPPSGSAGGLSLLNFDPSAGGASSMSLNQSAANALATVNGISVVSASNTLANISDGLNLTLNKVSAAPVAVTVAIDTASMQKAITDFVTAYSSLNSTIHDDTKYDIGTAPAAGTARKDSPLQGDATIVGFQNQLRAIINTTSTTSSVFARLSDIGVAVQADGSLQVNSSKLTAALQKPAELKKLFSTQGSNDAGTGIAVRFSNLIDAVQAPDGALSTHVAGMRTELTYNQKQQDDMQTHLDATQARLTAQYQALDTTMSKMNALSSYVTQQVTMMEKA
jgi:flagellar hook-associated protein 2